MAGPLGSKIRLLGTLTDHYFGRTVTLPGGWEGTLVGLVPLKEQTALALITGGRHVLTQAFPNDTEVEVWLQPRRAAR